jgi:predicted molibdopterin-dependent oxidoreductase YjgC
MATEAQSRDLRVAAIGRGAPVSVTVDGQPVQAFEGETVLAVLWAHGAHSLHTTARTHEPRGFFCGMGVCFDCLVTIDGTINLRACLETVRAGMAITLQRDAGHAHAG